MPIVDILCVLAWSWLSVRGYNGLHVCEGVTTQSGRRGTEVPVTEHITEWSTLKQMRLRRKNGLSVYCRVDGAILSSSCSLSKLLITMQTYQAPFYKKWTAIDMLWVEANSDQCVSRGNFKTWTGNWTPSSLTNCKHSLPPKSFLYVHVSVFIFPFSFNIKFTSTWPEQETSC